MNRNNANRTSGNAFSPAGGPMFLMGFAALLLSCFWVSAAPVNGETATRAASRLAAAECPSAGPAAAGGQQDGSRWERSRGNGLFCDRPGALRLRDCGGG